MDTLDGRFWNGRSWRIPSVSGLIRKVCEGQRQSSLGLTLDHDPFVLVRRRALLFLARTFALLALRLQRFLALRAESGQGLNGPRRPIST
jgi:hypothetical protein